MQKVSITCSLFIPGSFVRRLLKISQNIVNDFVSIRHVVSDIIQSTATPATCSIVHRLTNKVARRKRKHMYVALMCSLFWQAPG